MEETAKGQYVFWGVSQRVYGYLAIESNCVVVHITCDSVLACSVLFVVYEREQTLPSDTY